MFQQLVRVLAAEMALHKHNKVNRQGIVSPHAQRFFVLKNILPEGVFRGLQNAANHLKASSVREDSNWRKGQAIGGHELGRSIAAPWLGHISGPEFRQRTRDATSIGTLELVPDVLGARRLALLRTRRVALVLVGRRDEVRRREREVGGERLLARGVAHARLRERLEAMAFMQRFNSALHALYSDAKAVTDAPSLVIVRTIIGTPATESADTHEAHGYAILDEEIAAFLRKQGVP